MPWFWYLESGAGEEDGRAVGRSNCRIGDREALRTVWGGVCSLCEGVCESYEGCCQGGLGFLVVFFYAGRNGAVDERVLM